MYKLILTLILCVIALSSCSDRAAETMVYETEEPKPEETIDYDKEYRKVADQIGYVKGISKYHYEAPLIQDITEGYIPFADNTLSIQLSSMTDRFIPGENGDVYYLDIDARDQFDNVENGIVRITSDGKRERICLAEDCTLDTLCSHMQFYNCSGVYWDNCLYFACRGNFLNENTLIPGFILRYDLTTREMTKLMEIPQYVLSGDLQVQNGVLYVSHRDDNTGHHFYAIDLNTMEACLYTTKRGDQSIDGICGNYVICCDRNGTITAHDVVSDTEYTLAEGLRASVSGVSGSWVVYTTITDAGQGELCAYNMETHALRTSGKGVGDAAVSPFGGIYYRTLPDLTLYRYDPDSKTREKLADNVVYYSVKGEKAVYMSAASDERLEIPYTTRSRSFETAWLWVEATEKRTVYGNLALGAEGISHSLWRSNGTEVSAVYDSIFCAGDAVYAEVYVPGDGKYKSIPLQMLRIPLYSGTKKGIDEYADGSVSSTTDENAANQSIS